MFYGWGVKILKGDFKTFFFSESRAQFLLSFQESKEIETDVFTAWLNENWFSYLDVMRITARINPVILIQFEVDLKIWESYSTKMKTNDFWNTRNWSMQKTKKSQCNMWILIIIHQSLYQRRQCHIPTSTL